MSEFPVESMCRFMRVFRSAYYMGLQRAQTAGEKEDAELTDIIQSVFNKSRPTSGARCLKIAWGRKIARLVADG
jgi:hypothetical protein